MSDRRRIMAGPSVHQDLLDAMAGAAADEAEIGRRTAAMQPALGDLFRTRGPVLLAASSPAGFLEAGMVDPTRYVLAS